MRDVGGFRMGPFELMDLTGLDVTSRLRAHLPAILPRAALRPNLIMRSRYEAGVLGRKSKRGFYDYDAEMKPVVAREPAPPDARPESVWVSPAEPQEHAALAALLKKLGVTPKGGAKPGPRSLCLVTPIGEDTTTCAVEQGLDPARYHRRDTLFPMAKRRTIRARRSPIRPIATRRTACSLRRCAG